LPDFAIHSTIDIARRLDIRGPDSRAWIVLLFPPDVSELSLRRLLVDLSSVLQRDARVIELLDDSPEMVRDQLQSPEDDIVVLEAKAPLNDSSWSGLDLMRSSFERKGPVVFWLPIDATDGLSEHAPNLRSFIGGAIYLIGPEGGLMTDSERESRLQELRAHYKLADGEVIGKAESHNLPSDPHFVEWLALLGRGDLV
jgi:hypothetical protein